MNDFEAGNASTATEGHAAEKSKRGSSKDYNAVLEHYVDDSSDELDLVGMVAYALYKRQKRDWIIKYRTENSGKKPDLNEIQAVTSSYVTDDLRDTLRNRASDILSSYADTYVEAMEPAIRTEALNHEMLRQARDIEQSIKNQSNFWPQIWAGIVATAIWTLLVTGLIVAATTFGSDIISAWFVSHKTI